MLYDSFLQTYCFKEAVSREEPYISMVQSTLKTPQLFLSYNSDKQKNTRLRLGIPALPGVPWTSVLLALLQCIGCESGDGFPVPNLAAVDARK